MMREVFENIAEQSMVHMPGQTGLHTHVFSLEKFAELIVKECADIAGFNDPNAFVSRRIKEYFGVEE